MNLSCGRGLINKALENLNVELHIPGYQFCGPGTRIHQRLIRGDKGINTLDRFCLSHDVVYSTHKDLYSRHIADKQLEEEAWKRVKAKDSSVGEKISAYLVTNAMKLKRKLGMGLRGRKCLRRMPSRRCKKKKTGLGMKRSRVALRSGVVRKVQDAIKNVKNKNNILNISKLALIAARKAVKNAGGKNNIRTPRIIPLPKTGGFFPALIPLFAALGAVGSLAGGASAIANAVNNSKAAREKLNEAERHNKTIEAIALGQNKTGSGLYLKPYRKGMGIFLNSKN